MSITICAFNSIELITKELENIYTPEQIKLFYLWTNDNSEAVDSSFTMYGNHVVPIQAKYERNVSNDNFKELIELLGLEFDCTGTIDGGELVIFINKLKNLLDYVINNTKEFSTPDIIGKIGNVTHIEFSKDSEYWIRTIQDILLIAENTSKIIWY